MLNETQLSEAVRKGIISEAQLADLKQLAGSDGSSVASRPDAHSQQLAEDEAPRFFRSFNDLFIGLGVAILGYALNYSFSLTPSSGGLMTVAMPFVAAAVFWLLGEWLTARRRINFPSIIIALFFTYFFVLGLGNGYETFFLGDSSKPGPYAMVALCGLGMLGVGAFFARFKLPFAVLLFAGSIAIFVFALLLAVVGKDALTPHLRWVTLAIGFCVFAAAMWFDTKDPMRTKRTSDPGFWLHLLAAPIITHSVLWTSLQPIISPADAAPETQANLMVMIVLGLFVLFSIVALIIDRRAMLISSLGYAAAALGYIIYKFEIEGNLALVLTLLLIAAIILSLGTGWYGLRRALFAMLPSFSIFKNLPPVTAK